MIIGSLKNEKIQACKNENLQWVEEKKTRRNKEMKMKASYSSKQQK